LFVDDHSNILSNGSLAFNSVSL